MKKHIIVFTLFLLNALTSYSQELSGVYWNGTEEIFTSLDISTGTFTDLAILPNVQTIYSSSTFNSSNNHYAITTDLGITIINALDGTILNTITNTVGWTGMEFGTNNNLVGVYWNGTEEIFTSLDISTGTFTDLAILPNVQTINRSSTFNSSNNHYAITTDFEIIIINAIDGTILNTITNTVFWTGMEFNQTIPLSVNNYSTIRLDVYPNPVTNFLHIHSNIKNLNIQLINSFGQIVFTSKYSETDYIKFDLSKFSSGLYFLKINEHTFKKIIKK